MARDSTDVSAVIADHVASVRFDDLDVATIAAAKRSLLDAIGVSLAATGLGEGCGAFVDHVAAAGGAPEAVVWNTAHRVPAAAAALANGALAHALDFEDAHDGALVHPNGPTVPAAIAVAERVGASGADLLTALAAGADLVCRLGLALDHDPALDGWYPPAILQPFGAAAAASILLNLDATATLDALSLTLATTTGTAEMVRSPRSVLRAVRDGFGAEAGVRAALLAAAGVGGFERPFDGHAGLFALYARGAWSSETLVDGLGIRYAGVDLSFKRWPSCRGTHGAIQAALDARPVVVSRGGIGRVAGITVAGIALNQMLAEPRGQRVTPATAIDAKFSLPFTVAHALVHGAVGLDAFSSEARTDADVLALADRVRFVVDDTIHDPSGARLVIEFEPVGGEPAPSIEREVGAAVGAPGDPLGDVDLRDKFRHNVAVASPPLDPAHGDAIIRAVDRLETLQASDLANLLHRSQP